MKKFYIFLAFQFIILSSLFSQTSINAEITYIGNEGFMIKNNNKKVFIDALYYYAYGLGILNVDTAILNRIMDNKEQFSNADLFLITHNHPDHYDQTMMINYLTNNPQAKLVADPSIINGITKSSLSSQLIDINPVQYHSIDTTVNNIPLTVYNLIHNIGYRIYNVGYIADIDGLRIFHSGDNSCEDTLEYTGLNLNDKNIDIAFLQYNAFWKTSEQREFTQKHINPKYIVLMHIPTTEVELTKEAVSKITDPFVPIIVFNTSMEKAIATKDTIFITNHMPMNVTSMKDTSFNINTNVTIPLPDLFTDQDANDSLSYIVSGLPTGFMFNNQERTIVGNSSKAIAEKTIIISGIDRNYCKSTTSFNMTIKEPAGFQSSLRSELIMYPNPAFNKLNISNTNSVNASISIYDLQGKQLIEKQVGNNQIDISNLSKGIYIVRLVDDGNILINKLVKE
jgi:L-ascorbate metabolism protein UlaG (beta-lactamase superfamily)